MSGIYIHVPFCKVRCIYCDFYSTTQSDLTDRYVDCICRELELRKDVLQGIPPRTIYFGGGTPSLLQYRHFDKIFHTINSIYFNGQWATGNAQTVKEITLEANPDDLSIGYLHEIAALPFNRISVGIQTFDDDTLTLLRRRHTAQQAIKAVANCRTADFKNISIDLIYGLPGRQLKQWQYDLQMALELDVEHISAYHLIYEENTPIYTMMKQRLVSQVEEEESNRFFTTLIDTLTPAGYEHYEISNFGKPGKQSIHNSSYWDGSIYLGCGPSAHSYDGVNRMWNPSSLTSYLKAIAGGETVFETEYLTRDTRYNELVMTSLRTSRGLSLARLETNFGSAYLQYCLTMAHKHLEGNALEIKEGYLRLTRQGIFISDGIMSDLMRI